MAEKNNEDQQGGLDGGEQNEGVTKMHLKTESKQQNTRGDMHKYFEEDRARCFMNQTCSCCTCRCCALSIATCWIIEGAFLAYAASATLDSYETFDPCPDSSMSSSECCGITDTFLTSSSLPQYFEGDCDLLLSVAKTSMATSIFACLAGACGIVGLGVLISWLLFVPMGYAVVTMVVTIVITVLKMGPGGGGYAAISIGVNVCIVILFWKNYKLMKEILGK
eukprot:CAMPEP_0202688662 /NCGR_PEP_ID=MMETSP1385-20130828/4142_1 /ASSEMBLY_ACC=CAM_ASM_000861 /TAXON_ID=933848 /ORGANISM="Elphidium margaritaceum" /LENGTH=221 /DNA_ID=CAMNT_0049343683 /DNA_START=48 /DNA_END=713 /DNA_ORIENTATION=+